MNGLGNLPIGAAILSPTKTKYIIEKRLGNGAFGTVYQVVVNETNRHYAIKIGKSQDRSSDQLLAEITMYKNIDQYADLNGREYLCRLIDNFSKGEVHVLVLELYKTSVFQLLEMNEFNGFNLFQIQKILRDVASGMNFMHSIRITHCDLKPENIAITEDQQAKIIDFGSSITLNNNCYGYIQSRFYRAPEVFLKLPLSSAIDVWSFGCIAFELYMGYPIFAGVDQLNMLQLMETRLGKFPIEMIRNSTLSHDFFRNGEVIKHFNQVYDQANFKEKTLSGILFSRETDQGPMKDLFLDLIQKCLCFNPNDRITSKSIIDHEFFYMS